MKKRFLPDFLKTAKRKRGHFGIDTEVGHPRANLPDKIVNPNQYSCPRLSTNFRQRRFEGSIRHATGTVGGTPTGAYKYRVPMEVA